MNEKSINENENDLELNYNKNLFFGNNLYIIGSPKVYSDI
jgi:hypothetical protein